jgi:hypothetical protein
MVKRNTQVCLECSLISDVLFKRVSGATILQMKTVLATPGMRGVDCITQLTANDCKNLKSSGVDYVERYLNNLTAAELVNHHDAGLLTCLVSYSRVPGWLPSAAVGASDAANAIRMAKGLDIPEGATLICDLETPGGTFSDVIAYGNEEGNGVLSGGFDPGVYVGDGTMLTSSELYVMPYDKYQHSCSRLLDRFGNAVDPSCGWVSIQISPPNLVRAGVQVDVSFCQNDYRGRAMVLVGPS